MTKYEKLVKNSAVFAIGNFSSKFITLLMLPVYTSNLTQSSYGQIDIILTTLALLVPIFTVNIVEGVVRFSLDKKNYTYEEVLTNSLTIILFGFILLILTFPFISRVDYLKDYLFVFYGLFFIQALDSSVKQFSRSINLSRIYMLSDILYTVVFVSCNIILLFLSSFGIKGYFLSMFVAYFCDLVFISFNIKIFRLIKVHSINMYKMKEMIIYCIPLIPNTIMWWIMNISDRYLIIYFLGASANGLYAVANQFPSIISNFHSIFFKAWQVSAIEESEDKNKSEFYSTVFNLFFFIMVIVTSLYLALNKIIIGIFVSTDFYNAWKYAPFLVLGVVFSSFSGFIGTNYVAMKKTKGAFYTSLVGAIVNVLLNIILIPLLGVYGASIATMISFFTMWLLRVFDTRKYVKLNYPVLKMVFSIFLLFVELAIIYVEIDIILKLLINSVIILCLICLSLEYTKKTFIILLRKIPAIKISR